MMWNGLSGFKRGIVVFNNFLKIGWDMITLEYVKY